MKFFRFIPILALTLCPAPLVHAEMGDDVLRLNGIMAVVNDTVITRQQLEAFIAPALESLGREYAGDTNGYQQKLTGVIDDGLEQLIEQQLILHDFDVEGYRLPDSVVDELVQDRIREDYDGDRVTLMKTLQARGETFEEYRKDVRDQWIEVQLRRKNIAQEIIISPYQVENYYHAHQDDFKVEDEIKLRMIVLNKTVSDDTNTVNLAREIHAKIKDGAAFADMATVYSGNSQQHPGGDYGWVVRSVLRPELAEAAFALQPGQVSDVIETPDTCYLMLVEQVRPAHVKSLNEVRDDIEKNLRAQEQARLEKQWIDRLKAKTFFRLFS